MEYEPIIPPETLKQPEAEHELDPKTKKKKKKIGEWLTRSAPKAETETKAELPNTIKFPEIEHVPFAPDKMMGETVREFPTVPEETTEIATNDNLAEEIQPDKGGRTAKIIRFPRVDTAGSVVDTPVETFETELLPRNPVRLATSSRESKPVAPEPEREDDELDKAVIIPMPRTTGGGSASPPTGTPPTGGGGLPPARPPIGTRLANVSANVLRRPERTLEDRESTLGAFILGILGGAAIEHIRHSRREKRKAKADAKQQKETRAEFKSLEDQLIEEQNKKSAAVEVRPQPKQEGSDLSLTSTPEKVEFIPPSAISNRVEREEASLAAVTPASSFETVSPPHEIRESLDIGTPEAKRIDLKSAALKEDAGIITADVMHPVIERDLERNTMATFEGNEKVVPPKKLIYKQNIALGSGLIVIVILVIMILWLLK